MESFRLLRRDGCHGARWAATPALGRGPIRLKSQIVIWIRSSGSAVP